MCYPNYFRRVMHEAELFWKRIKPFEKVKEFWKNIRKSGYLE